MWNERPQGRRELVAAAGQVIPSRRLAAAPSAVLGQGLVWGLPFDDVIFIPF